MPMTQEEFEEARVRFGADVANWPAAKRARAETFLATPSGASFLEAERALDALFASVPAQATNDAAADAFLDRLLDIPGAVTHPAEARRPEVAKGGLAALWVDMKAFFSPVGGLTGQGVACAAVLAVGIFVGMQGTETAPVESQTVDLSASLFPSSDYVDLEDL